MHALRDIVLGNPYVRQSVRPSVRPSVCLTSAVTVSKRMDTSSQFLHFGRDIILVFWALPPRFLRELRQLLVQKRTGHPDHNPNPRSGIRLGSLPEVNSFSRELKFINNT